MLSHWKNYLFGASERHERSADDVSNRFDGSPTDEEDWVLVDSHDVISELPGGNDVTSPSTSSLEESWIVTQEPPPSKEAAGHHRPYANCKRRNGHRQPKGTKPRRFRATRKAINSCDNSDSLSSSIAVIPSPEPPRAVVAAAAAAAAANATSSRLLGSLASAKQAAAISAANVAKQKSDKIWVSRKSMARSNSSVMGAASGNHRRRQHLVASRLCGSNNNRKCSSNFNSRKC